LIHSDEQRHIAYGTWFLQSAVAERPELAEVVRRRILALLPAVAESVSPPSEGAWDLLGVEDGALAAYGLNALTRRLAIIGVSLEQAEPGTATAHS
jgi:ribonucleoside-diphosphate reductase beta chain